MLQIIMDDQPQAPNPNSATTAPPSTPPETAPNTTAPGAAPASPSAAALPGVPDSWPGGFGLFKFSRQAVMINLLTLIVLWLVSNAAGIILEKVMDEPGQLLAFVISAMVSVPITLAYLAGVRGQKLSLGQSLSDSKPIVLIKMVALTILVLISLVLSILLFIIPFFFVLPRLTLVNYYLVDKNMGILEAYKASWTATKGNSMKVWGIIGVTFLMILPILTIIGILATIYLLVMYSAAFAVLYEYLNKAQPQLAAAPTTPGTPTVTTASGQPTQTTPPAL